MESKLFKILLWLLKYSIRCTIASFFFIAIVCLVLQVHPEDPLIWTKKILTIPRFVFFTSLGIFAWICIVFIIIFPPSKIKQAPK